MATTVSLPSIHEMFPEHLLHLQGSRTPSPPTERRQVHYTQRSIDRHLPDASSDRKHVCLRCRKRFNRPSSLRIHMNTHTGATPFLCPYPGCGRSFNVNSNMRRHFRNHSASPSEQADSSFEDDRQSSPLDSPQHRMDYEKSKLPTSRDGW